MDNYLQWLDVQGPVPKDTTSDLAQRWASVTPVGAVGKVQTQIIIPACYMDTNSYTYNMPVPYQWGQFNYTSPQPFSLTRGLGPTDLGSINAYFLFYTIRYRVGTQMYRYLLDTVPFIENVTYIYPFYSGQIIQPQFSIEMWLYTPLPYEYGEYPSVNCSQLTMDTSILSNPSSLPGSPLPLNPAGGLIGPGNLQLPFPIILPADFGQEWNSN